MLSTEEQKKLCAKYRKKDHTGHVQCHDCPLVISVTYLMCHANSHYDPNICDFVLDEVDNKEDGDVIL